MLQSMGSQRVGHNRVTELNCTVLIYLCPKGGEEADSREKKREELTFIELLVLLCVPQDNSV